eukprot:1405804-Pleurochrysis_carterae.AAC.1
MSRARTTPRTSSASHWAVLLFRSTALRCLDYATKLDGASFARALSFRAGGAVGQRHSLSCVCP